MHQYIDVSVSYFICDSEMSKRFGDDAYAMEELVAELCIAFQGAHLGITPEPRLDYVRNIKHWLDVMKNDKKAIFTASASAHDVGLSVLVITGWWTLVSSGAGYICSERSSERAATRARGGIPRRASAASISSPAAPRRHVPPTRAANSFR